MVQKTKAGPSLILNKSTRWTTCNWHDGSFWKIVIQHHKSWGPDQTSCVQSYFLSKSKMSWVLKAYCVMPKVIVIGSCWHCFQSKFLQANHTKSLKHSYAFFIVFEMQSIYKPCLEILLLEKCSSFESSFLSFK